jgi:hypothetical protein
VLDYLCRAVGALARRLGADIPEWRQEWILDFHALEALEARSEGEAAGSVETEDDA